MFPTSSLFFFLPELVYNMPKWVERTFIDKKRVIPISRHARLPRISAGFEIFYRVAIFPSFFGFPDFSPA